MTVKRVVHLGVHLNRGPRKRRGRPGPAGWYAACGTAYYAGMAVSRRPGQENGNVTFDASKVTCRACIAGIPEERAAVLAAALERAALDGPNRVYAVTVRVVHVETVMVRVQTGPLGVARAEHIALLRARGRGAVKASVVVDKRHPPR